MKSADSTQSTQRSVTMPNIETGLINTADSSPAASTIAVHSEQPAPVIEAERDDLTSFFAVGIVVNLVMVTAYFFWAFKQWGKAGNRDE